MTCAAAIQTYYQINAGREWERLERHPVEFAVTLRTLAAHLPPPPARILDCGGGPGRYAIELARQGYAVTLFDLSPDLLALARDRAAAAGVALEEIAIGTATDLTRYPDAAFDAVLLMGPLYHLLDAAERHAALREAYRVVKPDGPVFVAFISRYAAHHDALVRYPEQMLLQAEDYNAILETGMLLPNGAANRFVSYFAHPTEVTPLCREAGFEVLQVLGVEGLAGSLEGQLAAVAPEVRALWDDLSYRLAADPTLHGAVNHLLAVCRKPRWRSVLRQIVAPLNAAGCDYRVVGGAALALRGLPVPVNDLDLEMPVEDVYRFHTLFAEYATMPPAWTVGDAVRSHIGRYSFAGIKVEVMGGLEWRRDADWLPSFGATRDSVPLDGEPVRVLRLEEEALAYLRRGRLERLALCLPHCDAPTLQALVRDAARRGWL